MKKLIWMLAAVFALGAVATAQDDCSDYTPRRKKARTERTVKRSVRRTCPKMAAKKKSAKKSVKSRRSYRDFDC